jgi:hypothetical protein
MLVDGYFWDINPFGLILDAELPIAQMGWKDGDKFILQIKPNGNRALVRIDPLREVVEDYQRKLDNEKNIK